MTLLTTLSIPSASVERLRTTVQTTATPVASPVQWALTAVGVEPESGDWDAGTWEGTYEYGEVTSVSPLYTGTPEGSYSVWITWDVGDESPVRQVGFLVVT